MGYVGFVQYGNMFPYRKKIKEVGKKVWFSKGEDIVPYLRKNRLAIYLETGLLYFRLYRPNGTYIQVMAFHYGTVLPLFERGFLCHTMKFRCWYRQEEM